MSRRNKTIDDSGCEWDGGESCSVSFVVFAGVVVNLGSHVPEAVVPLRLASDPQARADPTSRGRLMEVYFTFVLTQCVIYIRLITTTTKPTITSAYHRANITFISTVATSDPTPSLEIARSLQVALLQRLITSHFTPRN